ncbi:glycoside hydrolase family 43 protein [Bifidobacterium moukalabense]|uniref:glycoside hydrolase family 43 protein n=1 Tax=Bifidobacterium moukalabense TaxID=1333651 RepID=UPI0010F9A893|nr:glycoside hydrolase family 43 protein [Bifidobacterium moukalabense]
MTIATTTITNPILSGMYPDPSWIWDDLRQQVVLVNSSFELVPGLPIHVSEDLSHWNHAADAIDSDMARRLLIPFVEDSGGIYAPTLRRMAGKYVIACTVARVDMAKAVAAGCSQEELDDVARSDGNFVIEADRIEGPWRGPFWISGAEGIDPDVFEDRDGSVYWTQTRPAVHPQWEGQTEIWTQRIDPESWSLIEDGAPAGRGKTVIWRGYGMEAVWAEGPHLYRIGDYVYLLTAEGGTSFEHSEMAMRIHAPRTLAEAFAEYECTAVESGERISQVREGERCYLGNAIRAFHADRKNPILTHRHLGMSEPVQCVGHADLMHHPRFGWWMVCLGVREIAGGAPGELLSYLGRESFVTPMRWEHEPAGWKLRGIETPILTEDDPGWPMAGADIGRLPDSITMELREEGRAHMVAHVGRTAAESKAMLLDVRQNVSDVVFVRDGQAVRYQRISQLPCLMPLPGSGSLIIRQNSANYATFTLTDNAVQSSLHAGGGRIVCSRIGLSDVPPSRVMVRFGDNRLMVIVAKDVRSVGLGSSFDDGFADDDRILAEFDARFLSTEWAGGFVGCLAGLSD